MIFPGTYSARIVIQNQTEWPRVVFVEPFGEDFTLLPGESLDVVARGSRGEELPYFQVWETVDTSSVWIEGDFREYDVLQGGIKLECGHQRQAGLDAGLEPWKFYPPSTQR